VLTRLRIRAWAIDVIIQPALWIELVHNGRKAASAKRPAQRGQRQLLTVCRNSKRHRAASRGPMALTGVEVVQLHSTIMAVIRRG
jgi:hypothetical protein